MLNVALRPNYAEHSETSLDNPKNALSVDYIDMASLVGCVQNADPGTLTSLKLIAGACAMTFLVHAHAITRIDDHES
ncbi:MAG: hypothetical protein VX223_03255 [Myxococcota bacterium]|nr:hypothetical protein [Myxococcota bacterium]